MSQYLPVISMTQTYPSLKPEVWNKHHETSLLCHPHYLTEKPFEFCFNFASSEVRVQLNNLGGWTPRHCNGVVLIGGDKHELCRNLQRENGTRLNESKTLLCKNCCTFHTAPNSKESGWAWIPVIALVKGTCMLHGSLCPFARQDP